MLLPDNCSAELKSKSVHISVTKLEGYDFCVYVSFVTESSLTNNIKVSQAAGALLQNGYEKYIYKFTGIVLLEYEANKEVIAFYKIAI